MSEKTHTIKILSPSLAYLLMDRIAPMLNTEIKYNEELYNKIFLDIVREFSRIEADRIISCCDSAIKSGKTEIKIQFIYPEFNDARMKI